MPQGRITELSMTPVKGTALSLPEAVEIDGTGVRDDRLFHVVDPGDGRQVGGTKPELLAVRTSWRPDARELTVAVPGGEPVGGRIELGGPLTARVPWDGMRPIASREVLGPWSALLSDHLGMRVVLAMAMPETRAVDVLPLTLVSEASVHRVSRELGQGPLGVRRFRMNLVAGGLGEHEEDAWHGRRVAIGSCVLRVAGPVPRCAVVTRDPATGRRDADVLRAIVAYRDPIPEPSTGEPVKAPFGVYATAERPGRVRVGDPVTLLDD